MTVSYLATVPTSDAVLLHYCVLFCACFPFLCLVAKSLQTPLAPMDLTWSRSFHGKALSSFCAFCFLFFLCGASVPGSAINPINWCHTIKKKLISLSLCCLVWQFRALRSFKAAAQSL